MTSEHTPLVAKGQLSAMRRIHRDLDKLCMLCGICNDICILTGLIVAHYIPPMAPSLTMEEVAKHYHDHHVGVAFAATLFIFAGITYPPWAAAVANQMRRIPTCSFGLIIMQILASTITSFLTTLPGLLFAWIAYRPERNPEITYHINDLVWLVVVMPGTPLIVQAWCQAIAIFQDYQINPDPSATQHLYPKWFAWFLTLLPIAYFPPMACHFLYSGPLAWNGAFAFWVSVGLFGVQINVTQYVTWNVINTTPDYELEDGHFE